MNKAAEGIEGKRFPEHPTAGRVTKSNEFYVSKIRPFDDLTGSARGTEVASKSTQSVCPCCGAALKNQRMRVDLDTNTFLFREHSVPLGPVQAEVLDVLARRSPGTVSHDTMIRAVWGIDEPAHARKNVEVHIYKLRGHLAPLGVVIRNVFGVGYQLVVA